MAANLTEVLERIDATLGSYPPVHADGIKGAVSDLSASLTEAISNHTTKLTASADEAATRKWLSTLLGLSRHVAGFRD